MIPPTETQIMATTRRSSVSVLETVDSVRLRGLIACAARASNPHMAACDLVADPIPLPGCGCPTATPTPPPRSAVKHWQRFASRGAVSTYVMARQTADLLWVNAQANHKGSIPCISSSHLSHSWPFSGLQPAATRSESRRCSAARPALARRPSPAVISRPAPLSAQAPVSRPARPVWSTVGARAQAYPASPTAYRGRPAQAGRPLCMPSPSLTRPPCSTRS